MKKTNIITEVFKEYIAFAKAKHYSPKTLRQYDYALGVLLSFLTANAITRVQDVTAVCLNNFLPYLQDKGLSIGTQENIMRVVRKFFKWLFASGQVFTDPSLELVIPKRPKRLGQVPSEEEMQKLLAQPDVTTPLGLRDRAILEVAYGCGLRRSELAGLSIFDPDLKQHRLRVIGKGNKERVVPLGKQAVRWLTRYTEQIRSELLKNNPDIEALWINKDGKKLDGAAIRHQVRQHTLRAGVDPSLSLHSLRRACATHMLRNGAHPVQIQLLLGHANLKSLSQYLSVTITDLRKTHGQSKPGR